MAEASSGSLPSSLTQFAAPLSFVDAAVVHLHRHKTWDSSLESLYTQSDSMLVDIGKLMNSLSLENISLAGLSYDIEAVKGRQTPVKLALDALESLIPVFCMKMAQLFGPYFLNLFGRILNPRRSRIVRSAILGVHEIASHLLDKANQETEENLKEDKSIHSVLVWSKMSSPQLQLSADEILAQINVIDTYRCPSLPSMQVALCPSPNVVIAFPHPPPLSQTHLATPTSSTGFNEVDVA